VDTWIWIVIAVVAVVVVAAVAYAAYRSWQSRQLKQTFGSEYDRTVGDAPNKREAEAELRERRKAHDELEIRPLSPDARDRYAARWDATQARFVDDPKEAIGDADRLIQEVMRERGYPVDDFDRRTSDLAIDYGDVVDDYRKAHEIAERNRDGDATTEELRRAMVHYRSLFGELLESEKAEAR
jgi:hypothetical protein